MRLQQLDLLAFGPFTDVSLQFGDSAGALDIVYGPNEAGKSSALRGLRHFLYGIPSQTSDAFVHPYNALRIGATICDQHGQTRTMTRRKGRINTLLGVDESEVLPDETLESMLQGIDEATFSLQFGIDYESLTKGGRALAEGHGDLAKSLFSAASGIAQLTTVQQHLAGLAGQLFKAKGTKPRINTQLKQYQQALQERHELELQNEQLQARQAELQRAEAQQAEWDRQASQLQNRRRFIERLLLAMAHVKDRERILTQLAMQEKSSAVDADFHQRLRDAQAAHLRAEQLAKQASAELAELSEAQAARHSADKLLQQADRIKSLYQQLSSYERAQEEMRRLQQLIDAQPASRIAWPRQNESSPRSGSAVLQQLIQDKAVLDISQERDQQSRQRCTAELHDLPAPDDSIASNPDVDPLRFAIEAANRNQPQISQRVELAHGLHQGEVQLHELLEALPLWSGHPEQLVTLPIPEKETIAHFETELRTNAERITGYQTKLAELRKTRDAKQRQMEQLRDQYHLPTEQDLIYIRAQRDKLWGRVVSRLQAVRNLGATDSPREQAVRNLGATDSSREQTDQPVADDDASLPTEFAAALQRADELVDHLRRESDRVSQHETLTTDCRQLDDEIADLTKRYEDTATAKQQLDSEWEALWEPSGIRPLEPAEMHSWLTRVHDARSRIAEMQKQHEQLRLTQQATEEVKSKLREALSVVGRSADANLPLDEMLVVGRRALNDFENSAGRRQLVEHQRQTLTDEIQRIEQSLGQLEEQREAWQGKWQRALDQYGLQDVARDRTPEELAPWLVEQAAAMAEVEQAQEQWARYQELAAAFEAEVSDLLGQWDGDVDSDAPAQAVRQLYEQMTAATSLAARIKHQRARHQECTQQLKQAEQDQNQAAATIQQLCESVGCHSPADLLQFVQQSRAVGEFTEQLEVAEERIAQLAEDMPQGEFVQTCEQSSSDDLQAEVEEIDAKLADLSEQRREIGETVGRLGSLVEQLDGRSRMAELQTSIECLRASLEDDTSQFIRYQLATTVLTDAIQRYRDRNQGALLQRASEIFRELTLGGFSGLRSDYDDRGQAVLMGLRPGGVAVQVDHMSEGTCDQLFLALRMAAMEHFLDNHDPMPFVLDDVLIKFDDARSAAALRVFADLATRTQVVFFTHHEHLLELASSQLRVDQLHIHRLDGSTSTRRKVKSPKSRRASKPSSGQRQLFQT